MSDDSYFAIDKEFSNGDTKTTLIQRLSPSIGNRYGKVNVIVSYNPIYDLRDLRYQETLHTRVAPLDKFVQSYLLHHLTYSNLRGERVLDLSALASHLSVLESFVNPFIGSFRANEVLPKDFDWDTYLGTKSNSNKSELSESS